AIGFLALCSVGVAQFRLLLKQSHIVLGDKALFLSEPTLVPLQGDVQCLYWSYDHNYLVVCATAFADDVPRFTAWMNGGNRPKTITRLWLYDRRNKSVRKLSETHEAVISVAWSSSSKFVFFATGDQSREEDSNWSMHCVNIGTGKAATVPMTGSIYTTSIHPTTDQLMVVVTAAVINHPELITKQCFSIDPTGESRHVRDFPESRVIVEGWRTGSDSIFGMSYERVNGKTTRILMELSPGSSTWVRSARGITDGVLKLESDELTVSSGNPVFADFSCSEVILLRLELNDPTYRKNDQYGGPWIPLGAGYEQWAVSADNSLVAFALPGGIAIRKVLTAPAKDIEKAMEVSPREEILSRAKQVALAFLMYAADADDMLPEPGSFPGALLPYLKDQALTEGFVYTYTGERNVNKIKDPASEILGYVAGNGGRAVAYVDGHVKWIPDKD
ncbi:MAG: hypothetical protein JNM04_07805, partial [Chthonomonas sp.]|nr:hypothetical protein [Chthonomonas sp.]